MKCLFGLLIALIADGASLELVWEANLGSLNGKQPIRPAVCPDGEILTVVAGARYTWISQDGKLIQRGGDVFDASTQFVVCETNRVLAFGSGFVHEFSRSSRVLIRKEETRFELVLRSAAVVSQEWVALAGGKQSIQIVRGGAGKSVTVMRSQPIAASDQEKHRNGLLDGEICRCNADSASIYIMSPRSLEVERMSIESGRTISKSISPYFPVMDVIEGNVYRQGDSMYGLGCNAEGKVITQLIRRSAPNQAPRNLLIQFDESLREYRELDLTGTKTGLFVTTLPDNKLLFTAHTIKGGEKLRMFRYVP
jgi:hypothetical protein